MPEFKFQIGDIVTTKTGVEECKKYAAAGELRTPRAGQIVERIWQECPGGVQRSYRIGNVKDFAVNEIELVLLSEHDAVATAEAAAKAKRKLNDVKYGLKD